MIKTTATIEGMMCGMCEAHVNDAVRKAFDVKKVTSSHKKNETVIISEKEITEEELHKVIDPTGYELKGVKNEEYRKKGLFGL